MCKHCKSTAHSTLQHAKHYKNFKERSKEKREEHHMKMFKSEGQYKGKSLELGHGGRAARLKDELTKKGLPKSEIGGIIGKRARAEHAAPGQEHYHGHHAKK